MNNLKKQGKKKFCLIGRGISNSLSPLIHNTVFKELSINAEYALFEPPLDECKLPREFDGLNVTYPFKESVIELIDSDKSGCRSINTIKKVKDDLIDLGQGKDYLLRGFSTDGEGFILDAFRLRLDLSDVLIIGTGGSARSIAHALKTHAGQKRTGRNIRVSVLSRTKENEKRFCTSMGAEPFKKSKRYSLAVNCTPVRFNTIDFFSSDAYYDIKYLGGDGLGMLIYQALISDGIFLDAFIDLDLFDSVYKTVRRGR